MSSLEPNRLGSFQALGAYSVYSVALGNVGCLAHGNLIRQLY